MQIWTILKVRSGVASLLQRMRKSQNKSTLQGRNRSSDFSFSELFLDSIGSSRLYLMRDFNDKLQFWLKTNPNNSLRHSRGS